jgi:hypothetical protein
VANPDPTQPESVLVYLPVETLIRQRQDDSDRLLTEADERAYATTFVA